jgi:hypothetical protein
MSQEQYDSLLALAGQYSPALAQVLQVLAPHIQARTGLNVRALGNPFMPDSNMRQFSAMDALTMQGYTSGFHGNLTGISRGSILADTLGQGYLQIVQQSRQAEAAFYRSLYQAGAGYSYATSAGMKPRTIADAMGMAGAPADVASLFNTYAKMQGPMNIGERGQMLGQMASAGLASGMSVTSTGELKANIQGMESALAEWKVILGKDIPKVMKDLSDIFGGNITASYMKNAQSLKNTALNIQHVSSLTGMGIGEVIGNASAIGKQAVQMGGAADMAFRLGIFTSAYGGVAQTGPFTTREDVMGDLSTFAATTASSTGARLISGAWTLYRASRYDDPEEDVLKDFEAGLASLPEGAPTAAGLARAFNLNTNREDLLERSTYAEAKRFSQQNADMYPRWAMRNARASFMRRYRDRDAVIDRLMASGALTEDDFLKFLETGEGALLEGKGLSRADITDILNRKESIYRNVVSSVGDASYLFQGVSLERGAAMMRTSAAGEAILEETKARSLLQATIDAPTGTRIANAARYVANDPNASIKGIYGILFGVDNDKLLSGVTEKTEETFRNSLARLNRLEETLNYGLPEGEARTDLSAVVKKVITDHNEAVATGDVTRQNIAKDQLEALGYGISDANELITTTPGNIARVKAVVSEVNKVQTPEQVMEGIQSSLNKMGLKALPPPGDGYAAEALNKDYAMRAFSVLRWKTPDEQKDFVGKMNNIDTLEGRVRALNMEMGSDPRMQMELSRQYGLSGTSPDSITVLSFINQLEAMLNRVFKTGNPPR